MVLAEAAESKLLPYCSSKTWRPLAVKSRNNKGTPALVRHSKYQYQIRSPQTFQQLYIEASWVQLQEGVRKSCHKCANIILTNHKETNDICYYPSMSLMGTPLYMITATTPEYRLHHRSKAEMDNVYQHFNPTCYQLIEAGN